MHSIRPRQPASVHRVRPGSPQMPAACQSYGGKPQLLTSCAIACCKSKHVHKASTKALYGILTFACCEQYCSHAPLQVVKPHMKSLSASGLLRRMMPQMKVPMSSTPLAMVTARFKRSVFGRMNRRYKTYKIERISNKMTCTGQVRVSRERRRSQHLSQNSQS